MWTTRSSIGTSDLFLELRLFRHRTQGFHKAQCSLIGRMSSAQIAAAVAFRAGKAVTWCARRLAHLVAEPADLSRSSTMEIAPSAFETAGQASRLVGRPA